MVKNFYSLMSLPLFPKTIMVTSSTAYLRCEYTQKNFHVDKVTHEAFHCRQKAMYDS